MRLQALVRPLGLALLALIRTKMLAHGLNLRASHRELPLPPPKPSRPGANPLGALIPQDTRKASVQSLECRATMVRKLESTTCLINIENGEKDGEGDLLTQRLPDM